VRRSIATHTRAQNLGEGPVEQVAALCAARRVVAAAPDAAYELRHCSLALHLEARPLAAAAPHALHLHAHLRCRLLDDVQRPRLARHLQPRDYDGSLRAGEFLEESAAGQLGAMQALHGAQLAADGAGGGPGCGGRRLRRRVSAKLQVQPLVFALAGRKKHRLRRCLQGAPHVAKKIQRRRERVQQRGLPARGCCSKALQLCNAQLQELLARG